MSCYVGMDIGAVSLTAALLFKGQAQPTEWEDNGFRRYAGSLTGFEALYLSEYGRTRGKPLAAATALLEHVIGLLGTEGIAGLCLTGSGAKLAAQELGAPVTNEFQAIAAGLAASGLEVRTVFEMGGESSKYLRLSAAENGGYSIIDYATNGDCAAGTGAFIDQQAGRLQYAVEEVGPIVLSAQRAAQVAGRCSVFAKSDMIHAQQKGYSPAEVLGGLCDAVARNFRTAVVRSHPVEEPVALIGGVAANEAVVRAMGEAFGLTDGRLVVPEMFSYIPAIGAAVAAAGEGVFDSGGVERLRASSDQRGEKFPVCQPLELDNVVLLRDRVVDYQPIRAEERIDAYLGIDVGSVSTNLVLIDEQGRVIEEIYTRTQGRPIEVVSDSLAQLYRDCGQRVVVRGVGTTGSGRELIGELVGADTINDEITAHKTGATFIGKTMLDGKVPDTIFEIGGQDSKYISLQDEIVVDFTMNDACAAGTGSFLEERAEELDIAIKDQFAEMALSSRAPIRLGERCTVFMERDVNSYLQRGADKPDLVAGLAYSVVYNYINRVVRGRRIGECIFFQGGTAYNDAVAAAFAGVLGKEIIVPPHNGVIGAIGAALLARDKMAAVADGTGPGAGVEEVEEVEDKSLGTYVSQSAAHPDRATRRVESRFRGYDMSRVDYTLREFTCRGCSNACQIQEFTVEGEKTYWGDKCSDRYRKRVKAPVKPVIEDLFALRERLLMDESTLPETPQGAPTVGIPMTMFAFDMLPFWRHLLTGCGFRTVLSTSTNKQIAQAGLETVVAEPCYPIILAHGHVRELCQRGVDHVLLPNIISMETRWMENESHLCPWHQTLPFVVRRAPALEPYAGRFLTPTVRFRQGREYAGRELESFFRPMGIARRRFARALARAFEAQDQFKSRLLAAGRTAVHTLRQTGATGIVIVGRPYNIHDAGMNLSVARKLREYYGVNCVPMDFLATDEVDVRDVNDNMYWELGRRVIAAAKIVARHTNMHIIYITNFKCGPDSFVKHFIRRASGKPFLSLQFDGHSNDAGMMTRCEAYLDSKGVLRPWRKEALLSQPV